jgi:NAD(P)H dehydrogenase (quinone)
MAQEFTAQGHTVKVSNLYEMNWQSEIRRHDFLSDKPENRLHVALASKYAFENAALTDDVIAEQEKLRWADGVVFQFPLWWFSMPAILKGWFERVYSCGFAYGVGEHSDKRWGDRYGEGVMQGKRAMLSLTCGGWADHYQERGINGPIQDLLFPIHHGMLHYPGFDVLPPHVIYRADRFKEADFEHAANGLRAAVKNFWDAEPIPFRKQNFGDYSIPDMQLNPGLEAKGTTGFSIHIDR